MVTLDQIVGNPKKQTGGSTLDEILRQDEDRAGHNLKMLDARAAELDRRKRIAQSEKELQNITGEGTMASQGSTSGQSSPNTAIELVKMLVKQGMEYQKAMEMVTSMEPETMAKLAMLSGNQAGINSLLPLLLFSGQKGITAKDLVDVGKSYVDAAATKLQGNQAMTMTDFANAVNTLRPANQNAESEKSYQALVTKIDTFVAQSHQNALENERTRAREREEHLRELQAEKDARWQDRLDQINEKLENRDNSDDILTKFSKFKETAEGLGWTPTGAKSSSEELRETLDTVLNAPGVKDAMGAMGDRIRQRGSGVPKMQNPGVPAATAAAAAMGSGLLCDNCLAGDPNQGIPPGTRTVIPITPQTMQFTCPTCKMTFKRGGPQAPPPSGSPPGGSPPGGPPPRNPGQF